MTENYNSKKKEWLRANSELAVGTTTTAAAAIPAKGGSRITVPSTNPELLYVWSSTLSATTMVTKTTSRWHREQVYSSLDRLRVTAWGSAWYSRADQWNCKTGGTLEHGNFEINDSRQTACISIRHLRLAYQHFYSMITTLNWVFKPDQTKASWEVSKQVSTFTKQFVWIEWNS